MTDLLVTVRWIPVTEALPKGKRPIVLVAHGRRVAGICFYHEVLHEWIEMCSETKIRDKVTHFAYLPKPPTAAKTAAPLVADEPVTP